MPNSLNYSTIQMTEKVALKKKTHKKTQCRSNRKYQEKAQQPLTDIVQNSSALIL